MDNEPRCIREMSEAREELVLSPYACKSKNSKGRKNPEPECDVRTVYQRDRDRIVHSKAFRRLKHKTQVFLAPEGDHYRTRLTHTLEVSQISRTVARALNLNEDLTEAIALGHDLGHTPFGHSGERVLDEEMRKLGRRFIHSEQSLRVVDILERDGEGLNLTEEVRDGILNHGTSCHPATLEGQIVRICDKIAYINHDIDDAIRARVLTERDLPRPCTDVLGKSVHDRLNRMIHDLINNSFEKDHISLTPDVQSAMSELRAFMFAHVYTSNIVKAEEKKAQELMRKLYYHFLDQFGSLPKEYIELRMRYNEIPEVVVCDYIAGMTDNYAIKTFQDLFIPMGWE